MGAALLLTVGGGTAVLIGIHLMEPDWIPAADMLQHHAANVYGIRSRIVFFLLGALAATTTGLIDDLYETTPLQKVLGCVLSAILPLFGGIEISFFLRNGLVMTIARGSITVIWIVSVMNVFNLLDNMDGQCAGIASIITIVLAGLAIGTGQLFLFAFAMALTGILIGFLVYNFPPANLFPGDAGSMLIGYCVSLAVILFTFYTPEYPIHAYIAPIILLSVPFYDVISVIYIRWREGRPITRGDTSHFSHRLRSMGFSDRQVFLITVLLVGLTGIIALTLYEVTPIGAAGLLFATICILGIVAVLEGKTDDRNE